MNKPDVFVDDDLEEDELLEDEDELTAEELSDLLDKIDYDGF